MRKWFLPALLCVVTVSKGYAQNKPDADAIAKIKTEGLAKSKVMDLAFKLTDVSGPRLTNSPGYFRAANWAKNELAGWGLSNAALEPWGVFGKGWELKKSYIAMTVPYYRPLNGFPKTWTSGTRGLKNAAVFLINAEDSAGLEKYRGKLKGKVLLLYRNDTLKPSFKPDANRYTEEELVKMSNALPTKAADTADLRRRREQRNSRRAVPIATRLKEMAIKEGAVALLSMSPRGHDGTLFVQGGGAYSAKDPENFPDIMIGFEEYMTLVRLASSGYPVQLTWNWNQPFLIRT